MRDDCLLVLVRTRRHAGRRGLNLIGRDALYGRHWGCLSTTAAAFRAVLPPRHRLGHRAWRPRGRGGAQGEHKLARGYLPVQTHSLHWVADERFHAAIADYLDRERAPPSAMKSPR